MFLTILIFLIILLILVLSHEFGHFVTAKLAGVKVEEFAFGFPPRLFGFKRGETIYSFNLLPLGGFVKIFGEEGEEREEARSFSSQKFPVKIIIVAAGVLFNILLAYFLITSGFLIGTPMPLEDFDPNPTAQIRLIEIQKDSPAEKAGLETGDRLLRLETGREILESKKIKDVQEFISRHKGKNVNVTFQRGGEIITKTAELRGEVKSGEGALGIAMIRTGVFRAGFLEALVKGFKTTLVLTSATALALAGFFGEIFTGRASFEVVSGPVGIVGLVGDFRQFGFIYLIQLAALLSINLALINLIPFPGLDGGRILFLALEKLKGSPFDWRTTRLIHAAGFAFLLLLLIAITYHDILKLNL